RPRAPISLEEVGILLDTCPELELDGRPTTAAQLAARLGAFWLPDEVALYIGLASGSLRRRVGSYYRTLLGDYSGHSGGWPLKTLSILDDLFVHYARCDARFVKTAEGEMLKAFGRAVSQSSREQLYDADRPLPFANLQRADGSVRDD